MRKLDQLHQLDLSLNQIDWRPDNDEAVAEAADILGEVGAERLMEIALIGIERATREQATRLARVNSESDDVFQPGTPCNVIAERPTHVRYLVGGTVSPNDGYLWHDNPYGYKLWTHAWKANPTGQYAEQDHDHRNSMAAAPAGEVPYFMRMRRCGDLSLRPSDVWEPTREEWQSPEVDGLVRPGEAWFMNSLDIHSIRVAAGKGAVSIAVQGPRQRTSSYTFDPQTGEKMAEFPDGHDPEVEYRYADNKDHRPYLVVRGSAEYQKAAQSSRARCPVVQKIPN